MPVFPLPKRMGIDGTIAMTNRTVTIPLNDEFEWMGFKIKKSSLKSFIVEITRTNKKNNVEYKIEYLTVEGKIRILDEVCAAKSWHRSIVFNYDLINREKREVIVSCEITVTDGQNVIAHSKAYSYGTFNAPEEFAKLQTVAFNHAARVLGIGVESLEDEEQVENGQRAVEINQQPVAEAETPTAALNPDPLTADDLAAIERIEQYARSHPDYAEKVRIVLKGLGKEDLRELTHKEFETFKNVLKKMRDSESK